jgi:hypothetical protein
MNAGGTYGSTSEFSLNVSATSALIVDTINDVVDGTTTSVANLLANKGADGKISLREAIIATNNTVGTDTIFLPAGTYALTRAGISENLASTGDLDVLDSISIVGAGQGLTIIDGGGDGALGGTDTDRIFDVQAGTASLSGVTIQHGEGKSQGGGGVAVLSGATLTLERTEGPSRTTEPCSCRGPRLTATWRQTRRGVCTTSASR